MHARFVVAGIFLVGGLLIALAGASPQAALSPTSALEADAGPAAVKGTVAWVDPANRSFALTDGTSLLTVHSPTQLPTSVVPDQGVVVEGMLALTPQGMVLEAEEVLIGCPSKYQA